MFIFLYLIGIFCNYAVFCHTYFAKYGCTANKLEFFIKNHREGGFFKRPKMLYQQFYYLENAAVAKALGRKISSKLPADLKNVPLLFTVTVKSLPATLVDTPAVEALKV